MKPSAQSRRLTPFGRRWAAVHDVDKDSYGRFLLQRKRNRAEDSNEYVWMMLRHVYLLTCNVQGHVRQIGIRRGKPRYGHKEASDTFKGEPRRFIVFLHTSVAVRIFCGSLLRKTNLSIGSCFQITQPKES